MSPKGTVLIVDDDPIVLETTRLRLVRAGWSVETRDQALGTAQWIAEHQPDVVLLDVGMPAVSGDVLADVLRRNGLTENVAVILHSGMSQEALTDLQVATGAIGAIQKTGNDTLFLAAFESLLVRFRSQHGGSAARSGAPGRHSGRPS
jgi:two-component system response regulator EvgA